MTHIRSIMFSNDPADFNSIKQSSINSSDLQALNLNQQNKNRDD